MKTATLAAIVLATGTLGLASCSKAPSVVWNTQNIRNVMPDLTFNLTDDNGQAVTAETYSGDVTMMFFGYTHCPDICPATLAVLDAARQQLGAKANDVKILFVSVDPKRDGPKQLKQYVSGFGTGVVGLTGTQQQLETLTKRYRVAYRYDKPDANGNYEVYHSAGIFVFGPHGKARLLMSYTAGLPAIARDLDQLVALSESDANTPST